MNKEVEQEKEVKEKKPEEKERKPEEKEGKEKEKEEVEVETTNEKEEAERLLYQVIKHILSEQIPAPSLIEYIVNATIPYGPNRLLYDIPQLEVYDVAVVLSNLLIGDESKQAILPPIKSKKNININNNINNNNNNNNNNSEKEIIEDVLWLTFAIFDGYFNVRLVHDKVYEAIKPRSKHWLLFHCPITSQFDLHICDILSQYMAPIPLIPKHSLSYYDISILQPYSYAISLWIRFSDKKVETDTNQGSNIQYIIGNHYFGLFYETKEKALGIHGRNQLAETSVTELLNYSSLLQSVPISYGKWYHILFVIDCIQETAKVWVDGTSANVLPDKIEEEEKEKNEKEKKIEIKSEQNLTHLNKDFAFSQTIPLKSTCSLLDMEKYLKSRKKNYFFTFGGPPLIFRSTSGLSRVFRLSGDLADISIYDGDIATDVHCLRNLHQHCLGTSQNKLIYQWIGKKSYERPKTTRQKGHKKTRLIATATDQYADILCPNQDLTYTDFLD